jgi:hypothetical protein
MSIEYMTNILGSIKMTVEKNVHINRKCYFNILTQ